jgi:uncharacterized protein (TIGR02246 family)
MKRCSTAVLAVCAVIACTGTVPEADTSADEAAIRALLEHATEVNNANDAAGWADLFAPGAVFMPANAPEVTTRAGLETSAATRFSSYDADLVISPVEIVVLGDWAFSRTTVKGTVSPKGGGEPVVLDVKEIAVYQRQLDGSWKVARLIGNSNLPE